MVVHPSLEVSEPTDIDEIEADRAAEAVLSGEQLKRSPAGTAGTGVTMPSALSGVLSSELGAGQAMPSSILSFMESGYGADFSAVRIHTDNAAADMSKSIGAKAFTYGNDIFFGSGRFDPSSREGRHLIAHELAHVVQGNGKLARKADGKGSKEHTLEDCLDVLLRVIDMIRAEDMDVLAINDFMGFIKDIRDDLLTEKANSALTAFSTKRELVFGHISSFAGVWVAAQDLYKTCKSLDFKEYKVSSTIVLTHKIVNVATAFASIPGFMHKILKFPYLAAAIVAYNAGTAIGDTINNTFTTFWGKAPGEMLVDWWMDDGSVMKKDEYDDYMLVTKYIPAIVESRISRLSEEDRKDCTLDARKINHFMNIYMSRRRINREEGHKILLTYFLAPLYTNRSIYSDVPYTSTDVKILREAFSSVGLYTLSYFATERASIDAKEMFGEKPNAFEHARLTDFLIDLTLQEKDHLSPEEQKKCRLTRKTIETFIKEYLIQCKQKEKDGIDHGNNLLRLYFRYNGERSNTNPITYNETDRKVLKAAFVRAGLYP